MPSLLSRYNPNGTSAYLTLPFVFLATSLLSYIGTPVAHSLLTSAIAWAIVWTYTWLKLRKSSSSGGSLGRRSAWAAGGLLALGQVCERSVDGRGIWWAHGLLPVAIHLILQTHLLPSDSYSAPGSAEKTSRSHATSATGSKSSLTILTLSAVVAIFSALGSNASIALGLSYAIVTALAFLLIERAHAEAKSGKQGNGSVIYSANGSLTQPGGTYTADAVGAGDAKMVVIRDVALLSSIATGVAALTLEGFSFGGLAYWGVIAQFLGDKWLYWDGVLGVVHGVAMVGVHTVVHTSLLVMIQRQGSFLTTFIPLSAAVLSQLIVEFSFSRLWFAALCAAATYTFLDEQDTFSAGPGKRMRVTRILTLIAIISFGMLSVLYLRRPYETYRYRLHAGADGEGRAGLETKAPQTVQAPLEFTNTRVHPIEQLVRDAENSWIKTQESQSQSLEQAVTEYKRRYGIPPPPNFDKWYEFAKRKNVQLIDEYDTIYHSLLPFWSLEPATIRARAAEGIGWSQNFLMGLQIRDGKLTNVGGGQEWLQQAIIGMIEQFVGVLPDMDLAFNTHDEPRVVVPHDELERMVKKAKMEAMPKALANPAPRNSFSARPQDLSSGQRILEAQTTRFNEYAHQPVWLPSRLSCPPDSPARAPDENPADDLSSYALGDLGFVYNHTAFTDVCNSPSLSRTHGFFDKPNAFNLVHDLFPVFSQSKMSSFQDIVYPSPWYWASKVDYVERSDLDWKQKINSLLWRGSTTGGFSRNGGWRRQHRQHMVTKINALDKAKIMIDSNQEAETREGAPEWRVKEVSREDFAGVMDVHFSHIGQCDKSDCDAQKEFFGLADEMEQQDHWKWRYLLDMDGNAFSGRFYAFLKSRSLVFKMALFREWHEEWIRPWVHYVPLSLRGDDILETVRFMSSEAEGKRSALRIAEAGREWAGAALRNEDFEVWFFRLLLEYGRLVDDHRSEIGYAGS